MGITGTPKIITDGLIMHFDAANTKSYPGSGTTTTDLSLTAITASLVNGPTFSTDGGGSFLLDGTNDYIDISQNSTYQFTNTQPFTINSWVKCTNTSGEGHVFAYALYSGNFRGYYLSIDINSVRSGSFFFDYYDGSTYRGIQGITGSITTGSWVNIVGTSDGNNVNNMKVYQNGILTGYTVRSSGSPATINYTGVPMRIGARELGAGVFFKGNIAQVQIYNRALSADEVYRNYETTRERFNRPTIVTDDDARYFLNSANIGNETQQKAINDLVVDMKNVGLWSKMKAIYPFVGGTATTHKWNLKDPRDLDAAYRLQFNGGWTHSSTGADPNGTTAWADTYLNPSTTLSAHNIGLTYYSRENTSGGTSIGADNNSFPGEYCKIRIGSGSNIGELAIGATNVGLSKFTVTNSAAYFIGSATNSTTRKMYRNGVSITFNSQETLGVNGLVNYSLPLARNGGALTYSYDNKECAFATIGDGLTDADAANLYTIVQKYQTTLGRQV